MFVSSFAGFLARHYINHGYVGASMVLSQWLPTYLSGDPFGRGSYRIYGQGPIGAQYQLVPLYEHSASVLSCMQIRAPPEKHPK